MADGARLWTDRKLAEIELDLLKQYQTAYTGIKQKWDDYMRKGQERLSALYSAYLSAPAEQKAEFLARYQQAAYNFTLRNKWYKDMLDQVAYQISMANQRAIQYVNGNMLDIYMVNYNQRVPGLNKVGVRFDIADAATVRRLIMEGKAILPQKTLSIPKDMAWNKKYINDQILQGILQGESMDDIAKRIFPEIMRKTDFAGMDGLTKKAVIRRNWIAARRTARTLVTGAENRGRLDRYRGLEEEGLILYKVWIATPDGRTRDWHISMDGQEVPTNEMFVDGLGNELEYPGDPGAEPETVYNCRCSMRSEIAGIRGRDGKITMMKYYPHEGLHQKQINEEKERRKND